MLLWQLAGCAFLLLHGWLFHSPCAGQRPLSVAQTAKDGIRDDPPAIAATTYSN